MIKTARKKRNGPRPEPRPGVTAATLARDGIRTDADAADYLGVLAQGLLAGTVTAVQASAGAQLIRGLHDRIKVRFALGLPVARAGDDVILCPGVRAD